MEKVRKAFYIEEDILEQVDSLLQQADVALRLFLFLLLWQIVSGVQDHNRRLIRSITALCAMQGRHLLMDPALIMKIFFCEYAVDPLPVLLFLPVSVKHIPPADPADCPRMRGNLFFQRGQIQLLYKLVAVQNQYIGM